MINTNEPKSREKSPLKQLRERAGLTQTKLASLVGVTDRNVRDWENNGAIPSLDKAVLIAQCLNVSMKDLCRALGLDVSRVPDDVSNKKTEALTC